MVLATRLKDEEMKAIRKVVINMLNDGLSLKLIERYSDLSEAEIRFIAQENGLEIKE